MGPTPYVIDRDDPRAPSEEEWAELAESERTRIVAQLPAEVPWELAPPEGDHRGAKTQCTVPAKSRHSASRKWGG